MEDSQQKLGWFLERWRKALDKIDKDDIHATISKLKKNHPHYEERKLVQLVVRQSSRLAAAVGVTSSGPSLIPGFGTAIAIASMVPEELFLIRQKCKMILKIGAIYGFDPRQEERIYEIINLAGNPSMSFEALKIAKDDLIRLSVRAAATIGSKTERSSGFGLLALGRKTVRRLPLFGLAVGGAINSIAFRSLGRKTSRFYKQLRAQQQMSK
jgi:hypothetical protein